MTITEIANWFLTPFDAVLGKDATNIRWTIFFGTGSAINAIIAFGNLANGEPWYFVAVNFVCMAVCLFVLLTNALYEILKQFDDE